MHRFGHLTISSFTLGELDTNCYLVVDEASGEGIVIDPADDGDFISQQILEQGFQLSKIVLTHGHFDHVLGLLAVKLNFGVPIFMNSEDDFLLKQSAASAAHWLHKTVDPVPPADEPLTEQTIISVGQYDFSILLTPGHTPGSISLFLPASPEHPPILFAGDCLFKQGIGRTDFKYSDVKQMKHSLNKLSTLPSNTIVFSGHGEETSIAAEIKYLQASHDDFTIV